MEMPFVRHLRHLSGAVSSALQTSSQRLTGVDRLLNENRPTLADNNLTKDAGHG